MSRIEVKHLRSLLALAEAGTLVAAAKKVHLTQSALSHQLKELEDRLGQTLVNRKSKPIGFTPGGNRLLQLARDIIPTIDQAEAELLHIAQGKQGRLHMAIECHSCFDWLMPTLDEYRENWPGVEVDLISGFNFDPLQALVKAELDLVITSDPIDIPGITYVPLFHYESLLCLPKKHPLLDQDIILPPDLQQETLITYPVERSRLDLFKYFLDPANITPKQVRHAELTIMIIQLVASGRGLCVLPSWGVIEYLDKGYVKAKSLGENGIWVTLYAAIRTQQTAAEYMAGFVSCARECSLNHLEGIREYQPD